jgi:hypothetical protein
MPEDIEIKITSGEADCFSLKPDNRKFLSFLVNDEY